MLCWGPGVDLIKIQMPDLPAPRRLLAFMSVATILLLPACDILKVSPEPADVSKRKDDTGFPYNPLVYHLDLSILAYQLYGQTLVWPFDPFYEELGGGAATRSTFMKNVGAWAEVKGKQQARSRPALGGYRGPGRLAGFPDNPQHDAVIYRYDGLYPWNSTIANAGSRWVEYLTPTAITNEIRDVHMCYRKTARPAGEVAIERVVSNRSLRASGGRDVLLAFEGGTGDKNEGGQPASQSLMGFVLLRHLPDSKEYDIHVAFRGSRSGSLSRAVRQGISTTNARGNADWITDLGFDLTDATSAAGDITKIGKVHRGFAQSMKSILPQVFGCLGKAASLVPGLRPRNIYVTGHSLGGGLAQHFVSAALLGDQYGPNGTGVAMPKALRLWPWQQIKLISFSAPRAGDEMWARALTTDGLASDFHARDELRYDYDALPANDPGIVSRLIDTETPAGFRVLISNDAVTTSLLADRKPVGKTVYADQLGLLSTIAPYDPNSHEPVVIRDKMIANLNDVSIPPIAWRYRDFAGKPAFGIGMVNSNGTGQLAMQAELLGFYTDRTTGFDRKVYEHDVAIFNRALAILE